MTYKESCRAMCKACIYDPLSAGTDLEQIAACESSCCPLHHLRALPRGFRKDGKVNLELLASLRARIEATNTARANR